MLDWFVPIFFVFWFAMMIFLISRMLKRGSSAVTSLLGGRVTKEYGIIEQRISVRRGIRHKTTVSLFAHEKAGETQLVMLYKIKNFGSYSRRLIRLNGDCQEGLRAALAEMDCGDGDSA